MRMMISSILTDCLKRSRQFIPSDSLAQYGSEVPLSLWQDEVGRLQVWAANVGAHQTGQSSLEYRLRDASHIRAQIIRLLERLLQIFDDLEGVLSERSPDPEEMELDDDGETEIQQIYRCLLEIITCLYQISMAIRLPAHHDRLLGTWKTDATSFEPWARRHVSNKYPAADPAIVDRVGTAISRQRAALKYRERHHAEFSKDIDRRLHDQPETDPAILSETVTTEFNQDSYSQLEETASVSGISQTSYAPSLLEWEKEAITIPPPPKESANGNLFECPYCFFIITIQDRYSWARHVFNDLMPYTCIFPDCSTQSRLYGSRRQWYDHLQTEHILTSNPETKFDCPLCREEIVQGSRLKRHIGRHLEELALFALPRIRTDEADDQNAPNWSAHAVILDDNIDDVSDEEELSDEPELALGDDVPGVREWFPDLDTEQDMGPDVPGTMGRDHYLSEPNTLAAEPSPTSQGRPDSTGAEKTTDASHHISRTPLPVYSPRSRPGYMYICCSCGDGPKLKIMQSKCVFCDHMSCEDCIFFKSQFPCE